MSTKYISGWGNYKTIKSNIYTPKNITELKKIIKKNKKFIIRGMGRSYGDSSIGKNIISLDNFEKFIQLDKKKGVIHCSSNISIENILNKSERNGWFLKVSPGSKFISVGGLIASDVHGKNHHKDGTFCKHLLEIEILLDNGKILKINKKRKSKLFKATCGGMGLTGIIISAKFKMLKIKSNYIIQDTIKTNSINETLNCLEKYNNKKYVVGWIDTANYHKLGRSVIYLGEHCKTSGFNFTKKKNYVLKSFLQICSIFNKNFFLKVMSFIYYNIHRNKKKEIVQLDKFFYPLDIISGWNVFYGKKGFIQFQILIRKKNAANNIYKIISYLIKNDQISFLSTIKKLGNKNDNYLSFPDNGYTLTMDIKNNKKMRTTFQKLEKFLIKIDSKIYLTKDSLMSQNLFFKSYKNLKLFKNTINKLNKFESLQSKRLNI
jgi:decaprenylphospho-beta-D-ribofuranose 2-oxidase